MIYMRGQARDYDLWRQMGNPGWAWDDVLPYFKKHQDQWALEPDAFEAGAFDKLHARGGEWRIEQPRIRWDILDAFREAAAEAGIPKVDDFNSGDNEGCGYFHVNQKTGVRWNTSKGFLRPVLAPPQPEVETHAHGRRLCSTASASPAWCCASTARNARIGASREVILAAGAIGSPRSCSSRASVPAPLLQQIRHRRAARSRGRWREPAGPPADPLRLQGAGRARP